MPPKKPKQIVPISAFPSNERRGPLTVHLVKFGVLPKPSWVLQPGNILTVLKDKIRTFMWDPEDATPVPDQAGATAATGTNKTSFHQKRKINIEISFKQIKGAQIVITGRSKTVVVHTLNPIKSVQGHLLSSMIVFYFPKDGDGRTGVEEVHRLWKRLQLEGLEMEKVPSSVSSSSSAHGLDQSGSEDEAQNEEDISNIPQQLVEVVVPVAAKKRNRLAVDLSPSMGPKSGPASPSLTASLLEGEIDIPSSQYIKENPINLFTDDEEDAMEEREWVKQSLPRKKSRIEERKPSLKMESMDPQSYELEECLDKIKNQILQSWRTFGEKVEEDKKQATVKLWSQVQRGVEKTNTQSLIVAGRMKKSEERMQNHLKQFCDYAKEEEPKWEMAQNRLQEALGIVVQHRARLTLLMPPFQLVSV